MGGRAAREGLSTLTNSRSLTKFGDWSYALYLCHCPIIIWSCKLIPPSFDNILLFASIIVAALAISSVFGRIDLELYGGLKFWADRSRFVQRRVVASAFALVMIVYSARAEVEAVNDRAMVAMFDRVGKELSGPDLTTAADIDAKAEAKGLKRDEKIRGHIDQLSRDADGRVQIAGWALDTANPTGKAGALVFYEGKYWGVAVTQARRPDVAAAIGGGRGLFMRPGFNVSLEPLPCKPEGLVVVLLLTPDARFSLLPPSAVSISCNAATNSPNPVETGRRTYGFELGNSRKLSDNFFRTAMMDVREASII